MLEGKCEGIRVPKDVELIPFKKNLNEQKQNNSARKETRKKNKEGK